MSTATVIDPQVAAREAVKKITSIATLPEVTAKIISTVENPNSTAAQLHKIVAHDPALVTRILKVVNSAFYGLPGQIASIERAIVLLGLNAIKNIAVAASLGQLFRGVRLCEGFTARDLWTHCVAVGVCARELARQMKIPLADEAFLAGMIHDVGLLVSLQLTPDKLHDTCERARSAETDFCSIERDIVGLDHQQLGNALCEHWKFPRSCQLVASYHHRATQLSEDYRLLVTLVYVADTVACAAQQGFYFTGKNQALDDSGIAAIGLEQSMIDQVRTNLPNLLSGTTGLFA